MTCQHVLSSAITAFTLGPVLFWILANRTRRVDFASGLHSHYKGLTRRERYAPTSPCTHCVCFATGCNPIIYDIYKCQLLKFLFKLVNKQLPAYFNQLPFAFNNQMHHHETRGFKRAFVPRVNHEFSQRNIRYIAAVTYNSTSDSVIAKIYTHSLLGFSTYVNNQIIEHYNNRCTIEHCYSCRQHLNILNINFDLNI